MEIQRLKILEQDRRLVSDFIGEEYPAEIDFNWLMPVVVKFEEANDCFFDWDKSAYDENAKLSIKCVWETMVEAIHQFNSTKSTKNNMTPQKIKAKELVDKFSHPDSAKKCVDEILEVLKAFNYQGTMYDDFETGMLTTYKEDNPIYFWQSVKEEINKL